MNGVVGMTELLETTGLNEEQGDYVATLRNSADVLLNLINDILDLSKIEAGRFELEHVRFELRHIVEEVADLLSHRAQQKGLELSVLIQHDVPEG
ncbi:MAG: hybrid sensor histidine kinase/response regulator, partial [Anaerolineae bacterium]|nr:hybrid sensor histidine kinase/response regulator [Anaerolineae bacterium]